MQQHGKREDEGYTSFVHVHATLQVITANCPWTAFSISTPTPPVCLRSTCLSAFCDTSIGCEFAAYGTRQKRKEIQKQTKHKNAEGVTELE